MYAAFEGIPTARRLTPHRRSSRSALDRNAGRWSGDRHGHSSARGHERGRAGDYCASDVLGGTAVGRGLRGHGLPGLRVRLHHEAASAQLSASARTTDLCGLKPGKSYVVVVFAERNAEGERHRRPDRADARRRCSRNAAAAAVAPSMTLRCDRDDGGSASLRECVVDPANTIAGFPIVRTYVLLRDEGGEYAGVAPKLPGTATSGEVCSSSVVPGERYEAVVWLVYGDNARPVESEDAAHRRAEHDELIVGGRVVLDATRPLAPRVFAQPQRRARSAPGSAAAARDRARRANRRSGSAHPRSRGRRQASTGARLGTSEEQRLVDPAAGVPQAPPAARPLAMVVARTRTGRCTWPKITSPAGTLR